nr:hypothetical protein X990_5443 [Burkholderia pseudomallei MSHR4868]
MLVLRPPFLQEPSEYRAPPGFARRFRFGRPAFDRMPVAPPLLIADSSGLRREPDYTHRRSRSRRHSHMRCVYSFRGPLFPPATRAASRSMRICMR